MMSSVKRLARKLKKSASHTADDDRFSVDGGRPIDTQEQEDLVRSFEKEVAQQSRLWRSVFAVLLCCFWVFLIYSIYQQAIYPWELNGWLFWLVRWPSWGCSTVQSTIGGGFGTPAFLALYLQPSGYITCLECQGSDGILFGFHSAPWGMSAVRWSHIHDSGMWFVITYALILQHAVELESAFTWTICSTNRQRKCTSFEVTCMLTKRTDTFNHGSNFWVKKGARIQRLMEDQN